MGWKAIKEHYRIEHIVQRSGDNVIIGSPYVSELIVITPDGSVTWGKLGEPSNEKLKRHCREMIDDGPAKVRELLEAPDTFERSLTVFTFDGSKIIEKQCEDYGWPHVTHDGCLMYENAFSPDKAEVVKWAKRNVLCGIENATERVAELKKDLSAAKRRLAKYRRELAELEAAYP